MEAAQAPEKRNVSVNVNVNAQECGGDCDLKIQAAALTLSSARGIWPQLANLVISLLLAPSPLTASSV